MVKQPDVCLAGFGPPSNGIPLPIGNTRDVDTTKRYRKVKR